MNIPEPIIGTSLEWSKNMKEAGWPQDTVQHFEWHRFSLENSVKEWYLECYFEHEDLSLESVAAPTAAEIMVQLPNIIDIEGIPYALKVAKISTHYCVYYETGAPDFHEKCWPIAGVMEQTLADALAGMYCLLAERNLLPSQS